MATQLSLQVALIGIVAFLMVSSGLHTRLLERSRPGICPSCGRRRTHTVCEVCGRRAR